MFSFKVAFLVCIFILFSCSGSGVVPGGARGAEVKNRLDLIYSLANQGDEEQAKNLMDSVKLDDLIALGSESIFLNYHILKGYLEYPYDSSKAKNIFSVAVSDDFLRGGVANRGVASYLYVNPFPTLYVDGQIFNSNLLDRFFDGWIQLDKEADFHLIGALNSKCVSLSSDSCTLFKGEEVVLTFDIGVDGHTSNIRFESNVARRLEEEYFIDLIMFRLYHPSVRNMRAVESKGVIHRFFCESEFHCIFPGSLY